MSKIVGFPAGENCRITPAMSVSDVFIDVDTPKTGSKRRRTGLLANCEIRKGLPLRMVTRAVSEECPCGRDCLIDPMYWHVGIACYLDVVDRYLDDETSRVFSFVTLRRPGPRVVSEWAELGIGRDMWSSLDTTNASLYAELRRDIGAFLRYNRCPAHNRQTWMLAQTSEKVEVARSNFAAAHRGDPEAIFRPHLFYEMWYWYYDGDEDFVQRLNTDSDILATAKKTLRRMTTFVLTEHSFTWDLFDRVFGNSPIFAPDPAEGGTDAFLKIHGDTHISTRSRATSMRIQHGRNGLRDFLKEKNRHDEALYNYALELITERARSCGINTYNSSRLR